jgi:hypothetical protein
MTWEALCAKTIQRFNETPGAQLEAEILAHYEHDPDRVAGCIDRIAASKAAGKNIRSGWAVLRNELNEQEPKRRRKAKAADTRPIGQRGFASLDEQLANLAMADAALEATAREFTDHNRCTNCHRVKLPWWRTCQQTACVQLRRAQEAA